MKTRKRPVLFCYNLAMVLQEHVTCGERDALNDHVCIRQCWCFPVKNWLTNRHASSTLWDDPRTNRQLYPAHSM